MGVFFVILIDMVIRLFQISSQKWVAPLAAIFVGCICRLFFNYMAGVILDTIDTCFVCWAIDRDNKVDLSDSEFSSLVMMLPGVRKDESNSFDGGAGASLLVPVQTGTRQQQQQQMQTPMTQGAFACQQPNQGSVQMMQVPMPVQQQQQGGRTMQGQVVQGQVVQGQVVQGQVVQGQVVQGQQVAMAPTGGGKVVPM